MTSAVLALRLVLAVVFATAAVGKLRDLEGSRRAVQEFGVPRRGAAAVGLLLPLGELVTAVALVPPSSARWGAVAALALLLAFIVGIANALRRGEAPDCHCFGQFHSAPAGRVTLARNAVLAAVAAMVVVEGPGPAVDAWVGERTGTELAAVGAGICAIALGLLSIQLWSERRRLLRDLGTAQRMVTTSPPGIPVGARAPGFTLAGVRGDEVTLESLRARGRPILLVFMSPWCDSCVELLPKLGAWQKTLAERLTIAVISTGTPQENRPIFEEHGVDDVLVQKHLEAVEAYRVRGTPSAVVVTREGKIGSNPAESAFGIEPLVRLALREAEAPAEGSLA
jgi:methylamine dehydrogenase accessory protein MauD